MVKENEKLGILQRELQNVNEQRAIVFVNTKKSCDTVSRHLDQLEYQCTVLHGGKTQVSLIHTRLQEGARLKVIVEGSDVDTPLYALSAKDRGCASNRQLSICILHATQEEQEIPLFKSAMN